MHTFGSHTQMSGYRASTINVLNSHNLTWHAVFFGSQTIAENKQWSQIFSSSQCMDRQSALDTGTKNKHSHPRANHTHPLSQPRFRGNAMLPQVRAVSEIDQCFKTSGQVSLYRWTSAAISFSQRPCLILSKQYR